MRHITDPVKFCPDASVGVTSVVCTECRISKSVPVGILSLNASAICSISSTSLHYFMNWKALIICPLSCRNTLVPWRGTFLSSGPERRIKSRVNGPIVPLRPSLDVRDDVALGVALEREDRLFLMAVLWLLKYLLALYKGVVAFLLEDWADEMANCLRAAVVTLDVCASFEITAGSVGSAGLAVSRHPVKIDFTSSSSVLFEAKSSLFTSPSWSPIKACDKSPIRCNICVNICLGFPTGCVAMLIKFGGKCWRHTADAFSIVWGNLKSRLSE